MGVADNKTYKNQYHFTDEKREVGADYPSIHEEVKVNTTIKENPYRSNVEIEGKEIVLQPDLSALFKAVGKRHSKGGMDVLLKPDSFIFSDFDGLKISKQEHELFELKEGGKKSTDTPADVLKRNIDIKHYNTLVEILDDPYKDDLAKKTAAMMLEKYVSTLGKVAFLQEEKKDFPQGIPEFAMGTAPVYDPDLKANIEANKQFAKAGGTIKNPYYQGGGLNQQGLDRLNTLKKRGRISPQEARELELLTQQQQSGFVDLNNPFGVQPQSPVLPGPFPAARPQQYDYRNPFGTPPPQNVPTEATPQSATDRSTVIAPPPQNPQTRAVKVNESPTWGLWRGDQLPVFESIYGEGMTNAADKFERLRDWDGVAKELGYTGPKDNLAFQNWLYKSSPKNREIVDKWHGVYDKGPNKGMFDSKIGIRWARAIDEMLNPRQPAQLPKLPRIGQLPQPTVSGMPGVVRPDTEDYTAQGSKQADWAFTPWQKLSQLHSFGQYANVKRYMPYRSRYNATYVDPALVNPEQAIGDIQSTANQQVSSLTTLNPILRNAQASSIAGQVLNNTPSVRSQYDNQNAQILNQTRQYNNQVRNNETMVNMANDQTYYQQAIEGRKNFDNMRTFTANQAMNNVLRDVETNQKLAYNLMTLDNPAYGFDWRTGNFTRNPVNILDVQSNTVNERYSALQDLLNNVTDPDKKAALAIKLEGLKVFGSARNQNPQFQKKGGKVKKNPYKY